jgi:GGDEF domain-containing protein
MSEKNMSDEARKHRPLAQAQRLYLRLLVFAASLLASALVVIYNNSTRTFAIFIFLLFFGVGIMLALGLVRGVLVSLLVITIWIAIKQLLGIWEQNRLLDNLLELILAGLTFIFSGIYHDRLQAILNRYMENQNRLNQLDLEDKSVGLIKPSIGLLRLNEEEDRSARYRRPFALTLILVRPIPGIDRDPKEGTELMRAIAASIKDTTRETDIPFLAGKDRIAIILPETETSGANKVVNNIFNRMLTTRFVTRSGISMLIQERVQLRFGFAAFLGESSTKINMLEAAEKSLKQGLEINIGDLFQNLFIEWVTVGERPLSTPLFEKAVS